MKIRLLSEVFAVLVVSALLSVQSQAELPNGAKRIHVFVALCDNDSQGIVPVSKKIGNGDDPENNLYWGCSDGLESYFSKSSKWTLLSKEKDVSTTILRRYIFEHKASKSVLVADAYRGKEIKNCLEEFLGATEGGFAAEIEVKRLGNLKFGGDSDLVAYIGHNGLMEHRIAAKKTNAETTVRDAVVLCCVSNSYFSRRLKQAGTRPVLMTDQLMYPGSFALHGALESWFNGGSVKEIREAAAVPMAKNQRISVKAARGIFTDLEKSE